MLLCLDLRIVDMLIVSDSDSRTHTISSIHIRPPPGSLPRAIRLFLCMLISRTSCVYRRGILHTRQQVLHRHIIALNSRLTTYTMTIEFPDSVVVLTMAKARKLRSKRMTTLVRSKLSGCVGELTKFKQCSRPCRLSDLRSHASHECMTAWNVISFKVCTDPELNQPISSLSAYSPNRCYGS